jgi:hypothetical protein
VRNATLQPRYVDFIPKELDDGILYISKRFQTASHRCCCGCGTKIVTPIRNDGTHTNVNETIDQSVFERWRAVPTYRPPNLADWAARKKVDPAKLSNSVRADDPAVAAPD